MNTYSVRFFARCPINGIRIEYVLEIENPSASNPLIVEDIIDAVSLIDRGMHEEIADQLFREFGGRQALTADHHGVTIKTVRP
jgi:hypothetical protein